MFTGISAYKKKGRTRDWIEAEVELEGRPNRESSGAGIAHHSVLHQAEAARPLPSFPQLTLSLHQLLRGGNLGSAGISQLWQLLNSRRDSWAARLSLKKDLGGASLCLQHSFQVYL